MIVDERMTVRDVLRVCPESRAVLETHGLMGCGGPEGPDESLARFARAHGIAVAQLLDQLRAAEPRDAPPPTAPSPPAEAADSYRYFLRAAALLGMISGAALGAIALTHLATWGYTGSMPVGNGWAALIQAHGNAQLFGWTGLFVIGIALHSLPRMLQRPAPAPAAARAIFALVLGGLLAGLVAQPLAAQGRLPFLFPAAMAAQALGVTLFALAVASLLRRPREPYAAFVAAGTLWFWLGALGRFALSLLAVRSGTGLPPAAMNEAYLHTMSWGFLTCYVAGYSLRLLPVFVGLPPVRSAAAWTAIFFLNAGAAAEVAARWSEQALLSLAALVVTAAGVAALLLSLGLGGAQLEEGDAEARWLRRFARAAYGWLVVASVLLLVLRAWQALGPVSMLHVHALGGASRHALTVGFVSLMIVGVAWRILPLFSGAPRPRPALVAAVFGLLVTGCALRVGGQVAAGFWGGAWYAAMGISGWLELAAITFFALDVLRLLGSAPERATLPEVTDPGEITLATPVGPLAACRPWLLPVFARHGMGQVSNPVFQRTVGQRVTLAAACRRFAVDPEVFAAELRAADERHEPPLQERDPAPACCPECAGGRGAGPVLITLDRRGT